MPTRAKSSAPAELRSDDAREPAPATNRGARSLCSSEQTRSQDSSNGGVGRLFSLAHFIVVERPGSAFAPEALPPTLKTHWERRLTTDPMRLERTLSGAILRVPVTPQPISASAIRTALARGASGVSEVRGLLPIAVLAYIDRNQLYRPLTDAS